MSKVLNSKTVQLGTSRLKSEKNRKGRGRKVAKDFTFLCTWTCSTICLKTFKITLSFNQPRKQNRDGKKKVLKTFWMNAPTSSLYYAMFKGNVSVLLNGFKTFTNNFLVVRNSIYWVWFVRKIIIIPVFYRGRNEEKRWGNSSDQFLVVSLKHFFFL